MPNIIDTTYFERGNIYIPNNKDLAVEPATSPSVVTELEEFISIYEYELLLNALGVTLYKELQDHINNILVDVKWQYLIEGRDYTNANGDVRRWVGLNGGEKKQSVIAFYIFTEYLRNDHEIYATVGTVKNEAKNAEIINSTPKFIKAHHKFINAYQGGLNSSIGRVLINGFGTIGFDYYSSSANVSLFTYLSECNELSDNLDFPDFEFKVYEKLNSFGI